MNTNHATRSCLRRRIVAAVVAILALGLAEPAFADHKHKHHRHHRHGEGRHVHHARHASVYARPLYVPNVIRPAYVETYRPYYSRPVYYAPHGHTHALYTFPVLHDHVLVHESRQYCRGELFFGNGPAYGPQFSLRIAF